METKAKLLLILSLMAFIANGDAFAVSSVLNEIAMDLNVEITDVAYSVTASMLAFGFFTLFFGPLSDRFGKANIITIACFGSAVFSILSGLAWDIYSLIFFRAMGGMFAAGIMPVALSLTGDSFQESERQGAIAKVMGFAFLGVASATVIGGSLAYLGSWRLVYVFYGVSRIILSIFMLKVMEKDIPNTKKLNLVTFYGQAFQNKNLLLIVSVLIVNGLSVLGSFSYTGVLVAEKTGFNTLIVGLMLSAFGLGALFDKKITPRLKKICPNNFLLVVGIVGTFAFLALSYSHSPIILVLGLALFGLTFIIMQSSLVARAQGKLPQMKGTVMSLTSFCMNMGGALGTQLNTFIIVSYGVEQIFINTAILFLIVSILASIVIKR